MPYYGRTVTAVPPETLLAGFPFRRSSRFFGCCRTCLLFAAALHLLAHASSPLLALLPSLFYTAFGGLLRFGRSAVPVVGRGIEGGGSGCRCGGLFRTAGLRRRFLRAFATAGLLACTRLADDIGKDIEVLLVIDTDAVLLETLVFVVAVDGAREGFERNVARRGDYPGQGGVSRNVGFVTLVIDGDVVSFHFM